MKLKFSALIIDFTLILSKLFGLDKFPFCILFPQYLIKYPAISLLPDNIAQPNTLPLTILLLHNLPQLMANKLLSPLLLFQPQILLQIGKLPLLILGVDNLLNITKIYGLLCVSEFVRLLMLVKF